MAKKVPREMVLTVVGGQHAMTRKVMANIAATLNEWPVKCRLVREPDNTFDENAIQVIVDDESSKFNRYKIGYIRRQVAAVLAAGLDSGAFEVREVMLTDYDPEEGEGNLAVKIKTPVLRTMDEG